jgi:Zn-dependent peptidase ImmA (M78 family)
MQRKMPKKSTSIVESKDVIVINKPSEKYGSDGMSLFFESLPIVVIFSSGQSTSRQLFTLIHELVHLGLGQSVFDGHLTKSAHEIERYCDSVAGYVVAPTKVIQATYSHEKTVAENVDAIRKQTKASKAAIAIQLRNISLISAADLNAFLDSIQPPEPKAGGGFGQSKENLVIRYYGKTFVSHVLSALWQENISPSTAQKMLNIKPTSSMSVLNELQAKVFS